MTAIIQHRTNYLAWLAVVTMLLLSLTGCRTNRLERALETPISNQTIALAAPTPSGRNLQPQLGNANIDLAEVVSLLPPDAIRAILPDQANVIMISAKAADEAGMEPTTRVLGVSINGESHAYPIPYLSEHEIVNDEIGGRLIAATW